MKKFRRSEPRRPHGRDREFDRSPKTAPPSGRPVIGIHAVRELLKVRPQSVTRISLREKYSEHSELNEIFELAKRLNLKPKTEAPGALDRVAPANQGVVAFSDSAPEADWPRLQTAEKATLIALDEVEDPHNLGAVMRTAWLMGAQAVLTPEHRAAALSPAVSKVAQGACEHVPVVSDGPLPQALEDLKAHGYWILGLSHKAKQTLFQLEIPAKVVWVLGSESSGIRKSVEGACDDFVTIPQLAPEASYNVSVAAAIAMAETFRQHQSK